MGAIASRAEANTQRADHPGCTPFLPGRRGRRGGGCGFRVSLPPHDEDSQSQGFWDGSG